MFQLMSIDSIERELSDIESFRSIKISITSDARNLQTSDVPKAQRSSPYPTFMATRAPPTPTTKKPTHNSFNPSEALTPQPQVTLRVNPTRVPTGEPITSISTPILIGSTTTHAQMQTSNEAPTTSIPTAIPTKLTTTSSPSEKPNGAPTAANPTPNPTNTLSSFPTGVPTTTSPTSSTVQPAPSNDPNDTPIIDCPSSSSYKNLSTSGQIRIRNANTGNLCTLILVAPDAASFKPVGRSYEGYDWETSSGEFSTLKWTCSSSLCIVNLPLPPEGSIYQLTTFTSSDVDRKPIDELFRFYEQASFGPTPDDLIYYSNDLDSSIVKMYIHNWIDVQMLEAPATSHREIFRSRMNVRMEVDTRMAAVTHPCQEGTYYRKFAISVRDSGKLMKVTSVGTKKVLMALCEQ
jgi:hypothetical protein